MQQRDPPNAPRGDLHIRDLARHPDDEREVGEVEEVRLRLVRKNHADVGRLFARLFGDVIANVRVVQRQHRMHEQLRGDNGEGRERDVPAGFAACQPFGGAKEQPSAEESGDRGKNHATADGGAAGILQPGLAHARSSVCQDHACPREHQRARRERIPRGNQAHRPIAAIERKCQT